MIAKDDDSLKYFEVAGADYKFVWAVAKIDGNQVKVQNKQILHPVYVRYAWADNPDRANLYNREGFPASPFEAEVTNNSH